MFYYDHFQLLTRLQKRPACTEQSILNFLSNTHSVPSTNSHFPSHFSSLNFRLILLSWILFYFYIFLLPPSPSDFLRTHLLIFLSEARPKLMNRKVYVSIEKCLESLDFKVHILFKVNKIKMCDFVFPETRMRKVYYHFFSRDTNKGLWALLFIFRLFCILFSIWAIVVKILSQEFFLRFVYHFENWVFYWTVLTFILNFINTIIHALGKHLIVF